MNRQHIDRGHGALLHEELLEVKAGGGPLAVVRKRADAPARGAVLLIHGFAQNRYSWHLSQRSFENYLASHGYDVFNLDLRGHGRSRELGSTIPKNFDDYAFDDFPAVVEAVCKASQQEKIFVIGHSLGGAIVYAAAPQLLSRIRGIITLGGVFHYGRGLPIIKSLGFLLRPVLQNTPLSSMTFRSGLIAKTLTVPVMEPLLSTAYLLPWESGSIERPILKEYLQLSFDRTSFQIIAEIFEWMRHDQFGGEREFASQFFALNVPLFVISADRDRFNDASGVKPAYDGSQSLDKTYLELSPENAGGHYGHADMIIGSRAPLFVWPKIRKWLDAR